MARFVCSDIPDFDQAVAQIAGTPLGDGDDRTGGNAGVGANDAPIAAMVQKLGDSVLTDDVEEGQALTASVEDD